MRENAGLGCHTLLLLDIKVKEQSEANMARCVSPFPMMATRLPRAFWARGLEG